MSSAEYSSHAASALDGNEMTYIHTRKGINEFWGAILAHKAYVNEVRIQGRHEYVELNQSLSKAEITVDGKLCGNLPENIEKVASVWFTVTCLTPVVGSSILVRSTREDALHFS